MNANSPPPPPPQPIALPEPVPALVPPRPLPEPPRRTASAITAEANAEHMFIDVPPPELGYQWTAGKVDKAKEAHANRLRREDGKGFVGGFVSGLKKLPRAFARRRPRRGTEATEFTEATTGTGNTLPQYHSQPPTPLVPDHTPSAPFAPPEPYRPSFILIPPDEETQLEIDSGVVVSDGGMPGGFDSAAGPSTRVRPPTPSPPAARTRSHTPAPSPHPSGAHLTPPDNDDGDEPVSVHAHPQPTEDYRRMSAHDAAVSRQHSLRSRTTVDSPSGSFSEPSFAEELHGPLYRFFRALHMLPWIATDRVTVDWKPPKQKLDPQYESVSWYYPMGHGPPPSSRAVSLLDSNATTSPISRTGRRSAEAREIGRDVHIRRYRSTRPRHAPVEQQQQQPQRHYVYTPYPVYSPTPSPPPPSAPPRRSPRPTSVAPLQPRRRHRRRRSSIPSAPRQQQQHRHHRDRNGTDTPVAHWGHMPVPLPVQMQMSPQIMPSVPMYVIQASPAMSETSAHGLHGAALSDTNGTAGSHSPAAPNRNSPNVNGSPPAPVSGQEQERHHRHQHHHGHSPRALQMLAPVYMPMPVDAGAHGSPNSRPAGATSTSPGPHYAAAYGYPYGYPYGYGYGSPMLQMQMATPVSMQGS
uniref:Uncharacterized protein n=1 Tax=Mycena chlorophos TaxID=658473 RepID=A0ABQ0LCF3_MYCCL|nr:predicted protein [Mycena chlorophos]